MGMRTSLLCSRTVVLSFLIGIVVFVMFGCGSKAQFHYNSRPTEGEFGESPFTEEEFEAEAAMLRSYSVSESEYVPIAAKKEVLKYETDADDLLLLLNGNDLVEEVQQPVYTDGILSVTSQEPRYSKMLFCFSMGTYHTFDRVTLTFRFDNKEKTKSKISFDYVIPSFQYWGCVEMPPGAAKVKLVSAKLEPKDFDYSRICELNVDSKNLLRRIGNNTIYFSTKKRFIVLIFNKLKRVTDCLELYGRGTITTSHGVKYFCIIE